jgi:Zn-dependent M28 family amino/carboxypeptidase
MRKLVIVAVVGTVAALASLTFRPGPPALTVAAQTQQAGFDSSRAWAHLGQLVSIGPRPAGSAGIRQARAYITRELSAMDLTVQEQPFVAETPLGPIEMVNLIVTLPGRRSDKILLTGHYDTKLFREFVFVGANDGGSSGAFLIELARALKDLDREFTWELVWFDGEEAVRPDWADPDHTYGSRYYVEAAREAEALDSLRAMILVDMIGERDARFFREGYSTAWLKDIIWGTADELGHGVTFPTRETPIEDDHVEFLSAGVDSVDIIDLDYGPAMTWWHTAEDTPDKLSARSLQIVGDVLLASLPKIEAYLQR